MNLLQWLRAPRIESHSVRPQEVGRVLGVDAFAPGDLVFIDPDTPRFVQEHQPCRDRGLVTIAYHGQHCEASHHCYPSHLSYPAETSLWSSHQHQAFKQAEHRQHRAREAFGTFSPETGPNQ